MVSLSETDLAVFARLGRMPDGPLVRQVLRKMQDDADARCRTREGADLHRAQGEAELLRRLHEYLDGAAADRLERLQTVRTDRAQRVSHFPDPAAA